MRLADQKHLLDLNLGGREAQVNALLDRNPMGAQVAGIVSGARSEEYQDLANGLPDEAARARRLGISQLKLTRQNYIDSFSGVQVAKDFPLALAFMPKLGEDPGKVLRTIQNGMGDLSSPGSAEKPLSNTEMSRILDDALKNAVNLFKDAIAQ
jgi:hypothetical protein